MEEEVLEFHWGEERGEERSPSRRLEKGALLLASVSMASWTEGS